MAVNYLEYALARNHQNQEAFNTLGQALDTLRSNQRLDSQESRLGRLSELQAQNMQGDIENEGAQRAAVQQVYGGKSLTDAYAKQMKAEQRRKNFEAFNATMKTQKEQGMSAASRTTWARQILAQDPEFAEIAPQISYIDDQTIKIVRPIKDNEIRDPTRPGQYLPAGTYEMEGIATGDPENPYKPNSIKPYVDREAMQDKRLAAQDAMLDKRLVSMEARSERRGTDRTERMADKQRERVQRQIEGYKKKMDELYATEGDSDAYRSYRRGLQNLINEAERDGIEWDNSSVGLDLVPNKPAVKTRKGPIAINMNDPKVQAALKAGYSKEEIAAYLAGGR